MGRVQRGFHWLECACIAVMGGLASTHGHGQLPCIFTQVENRIVIEAEHFSSNTARGQHSWVLATSPAGASGGYSLLATPDIDATLDTNYQALAPQLDYRIVNTTPGTWYVWLRGNGKDFDANSCHVGVDGTAPATGAIVETFQPDGTWVWVGNTRNNGRARIALVTAGEHTLHVWMREDGFSLDKILLTTDSAETPSGSGPAESGCAATATPTRTPQPGSSPTVTPTWDDGIYLNVPAGGFFMGRTGNEGGVCSDSSACYQDELPTHYVEVPAFTIRKNEVTNAEYAVFLNAVGRASDAEGRPYLDITDPQVRVHHNGQRWVSDAGWESRPMAEVSWYGAQAYARWVGGRLPTEAEWEKAARWDAGAQYSRVWPWGDIFDCARNSSWWCNDPDEPRPVGSFPSGASPCGALDMAGNVWEWTMGGYHGYPGGPLTFSDYTREVQKGGSWTNSDYNLRCATRSPQPPYITDANLGFRVVRSAVEPQLPSIQVPPRETYNEWAEEFTTATAMDETRAWWGSGSRFEIQPANGWLLAEITNARYPSGEYMAMVRRSTGNLFAPGDLVDITVRLRYERGDRDYARASVAVAWGNTRTIEPGGRGADENTGFPWYLIANNSDTPGIWQEVTAQYIPWGGGQFCIGVGLWCNLADRASPPILDRMQVLVDAVRVRHSRPVAQNSAWLAAY